MSSVAGQIKELWFQNGLNTRRPDVKRFVDLIMALAGQCGWIAGRATDDAALSFSAGDGTESDVQYADAKGMFRAVCARLGTFIAERTDGFQFNPYQGKHDVEIDVPDQHALKLRICYTNTTSEQRFRIDSMREE